MQSKTNKYKKVFFAEECSYYLEVLKNDIDFIFEKDSTLSGNCLRYSWIRFFNTRLVKFSKSRSYYKNMCVRSHSFRINFVTALLKKAPLQVVSEIIGHSSVNTTNRYNRNRISKEEHLELLKGL